MMKALIAWLAVVVAVVVVVAVFVARRSDHAEPTGLYGTVHVPKSSPLCAGGRRCPPARHKELVLTKGTYTAVLVTDGRGRFRTLLEPGRYATSLIPASVTVRVGHFDRHDFVTYG